MCTCAHVRACVYTSSGLPICVFSPLHAGISRPILDLYSQVLRCVNRGGKVLIPVYAVGRAQELMILVEEAWQRLGLVGKVPIFFSGHMAARANGLYRAMVRQSGGAHGRMRVGE